jgi:hypothetical protein
MSAINEIAELQKEKLEIEVRLKAALRKLKCNAQDIASAATQIRLSYQGRVIEMNKDPGCCGVPSFEIHVAQCQDPASWVHSSLDGWIKHALSVCEN